jgi:hypothetical protein
MKTIIPQNYNYFRYLRSYWSEHGLPRLQNLNDDDVILTLDADEIPSEEVSLFKSLVYFFAYLALQPILIGSAIYKMV